MSERKERQQEVAGDTGGPRGATHPASGGRPVESSEGSGRRTFFRFLIGGMGAAAAASIAYPVGTFLKLPRVLSGSEAVSVPEASIGEGQALYREHQGEQVVIIRTRGVIRVFNASCTHLGCLVSWDHVAKVFRCPCHGAVFANDGAPVSGPVNAPLVKVEYVQQDGVLTLS